MFGWFKKVVGGQWEMGQYKETDNLCLAQSEEEALDVVNHALPVAAVVPEKDEGVKDLAVEAVGHSCPLVMAASILQMMDSILANPQGNQPNGSSLGLDVSKKKKEKKIDRDREF